MRRDELRAAIDRDPDAIVELVMTLTASVAALRAEVDELKRQAGRELSTGPTHAVAAARRSLRKTAKRRAMRCAIR